MDIGHIHRVDFDQTKNVEGIAYVDDGIAILENIQELPVENGLMQIDMVVMVACTKGKLSVEMNTMEYTIRQNQILICLPNSKVSNCMLSFDFEGAAMCLAPRGLLEQFSKNELWNMAFPLVGSPVVNVDEKDMHLFSLYSSILEEKLKMKQSWNNREVIFSIVRAILYEILAYTKKNPRYTEVAPVTQGGVLFKGFIELLSSTRIKPRNMSWYAEQLHVSPKYLSAVCKQVSGKTASSWINEYVVVDIRFWLKNSDKSIKEIANLLEFPSISFFGKYCRTHFGSSPTELRRQLREQTRWLN